MFKPAPGVILLATASLLATAGRSADATSPVDYRERNTTYAPSGTVAPDKRAPETNGVVQDKRVETKTLPKPTAPLAERRAAIDVREARDKAVREKDSKRPEKIETPNSSFNHREAAISTGANTSKPPTVAKYQDSLASASASNMARFPAIDKATGAKINRFVFRKNPDDSAALAHGAPVTPAAGEAEVRR